tara:strand:+ start:440 stop:1060 length:621 start_codon:yes stop_codon:yes gene_type:complete
MMIQEEEEESVLYLPMPTREENFTFSAPLSPQNRQPNTQAQQTAQTIQPNTQAQQTAQTIQPNTQAQQTAKTIQPTQESTQEQGTIRTQNIIQHVLQSGQPTPNGRPLSGKTISKRIPSNTPTNTNPLNQSTDLTNESKNTDKIDKIKVFKKCSFFSTSNILASDEEKLEYCTVKRDEEDDIFYSECGLLPFEFPGIGSTKFVCPD